MRTRRGAFRWLLLAGMALAAPAGAETACVTAVALTDAGCLAGTADPAAPALLTWTSSGAEGPGWSLDLQAGYASARVIVSGAAGELFRLEIPEGGYSGRMPLWVAAPGDYALRIEAGGASPFRLRLAPVPVDLHEAGAHADAATAMALPAGARLAGEATTDPDVFALDMTGAAARRLYRLTLAMPPGGMLDLLLAGPDGQPLYQTRTYAPELVLSDLGFDPGAATLTLTAPGDPVPYLLSLEATGPRVQGREAEPNDTAAGAQPLVPGKPASGRIATTGDVDAWRLEVTAAQEKALIAIALKSRTERTLCLTDTAGAELQCRRGVSPALSGLGLKAGSYLVTVAGLPAEDDAYALTARLAGPRRPGVEVEPNDSVALAGPLAEGVPVAGTLDGEDTDWYALHVEGAAQLWTIAAAGAGAARVVVSDFAGAVLGSGEGEGGTGAEARDVFLLPGDYSVSVSGTGGATGGTYRLTATPTGPPDASAEREPNDSDAEAQRLGFDAPRTGSLSDSSDRDTYRFSLYAPEHLRLSVEPAAPAAIEVELEWGYPSTRRPQGTTEGGPFVYDAVLEPGDYVVRLKAPARVGYRIGLARADPFDIPSDFEPNDTPGQAHDLPADGHVDGHVASFRDADWFRLPPPTADTTLTVAVTGSVTAALQENGAPVVAGPDGAFPVTAGGDLRLGVTGDGAYGLDARLAGEPPPAPLAPAPVEVSLALETGKVAAFWVRGQRVQGTATVANRSDAPAEVELALVSSHFAYRPEITDHVLRLAPGETRQVPVTVAVAPDTWADQPVSIALSASAAGHRPAGARAGLVAEADAVPVAQEMVFPLPAALTGGFNIASAALGGLISLPDGDTSGENPATLQDGLVGDANTGAFAVPVEALPYVLTLRFPGMRAWTVAGIAINPQAAGRVYPAEQLRDFDLLLSEDGETFAPALSAALTALPIEQTFVLPHPVTARAAQLRLKSNHADNVGKVGLGEWKVILVPGEPEGVSADLAEFRRGGHVAWENVVVGSGPEDERAMLGEGRSVAVTVPAGLRPEWVIGFHEDRAARITTLEWETGDARDGQHAFPPLAVAVSRDGPLGPWETVGTWAVDPAASGPRRWDLPAPIWARFLRFTATAPAAEELRWTWPKALRVFEQPTGGGYRSVLAEWGQYNRAAIYEAGLPLPPPVTAAETAANAHQRAAARPLPPDGRAAGEARLNESEDWFSVEVPEGMNRLDLALSGEPTVDVEPELSTADGAAVPLLPGDQAPDRRAFAATVAPGRYLLRIHEPPRSVAIAFDTSPSLANFAPVIRHAVADYAAGTVPGREYVNFLNFGSPFILKDWSDQPWVLEGAVLGRPPPGQTDSSDLEATLGTVLGALAERSGVRAAILATDAETPGYPQRPEVWARLAAVRPRLFPAHIGAGRDPQREKQIMQDLASVNGGFFASARTQAEMDVVAERAAAWLRHPARYRLEVTTRHDVPPEPGTLRVVAASKPAGAAAPAPAVAPSALRRGAIEVILDASGSMLQRLDGERRIAIAHATLGKLVTETLPAGTPFALRAFGDDRPGSCETRLAAPLAPLDGRALAAQIDRVMPKNLAKTPIAASLRAVREDLASAEGQRTVILVTDGEETCGGDPEAEIAALRAGGFDVRVNIVGFAVDDAGLKETFRRWAETGGGRYLDAADARGLDAAVEAAVALPFRVRDAAGAVVAEGVVGGEAVTLPPGTYGVEIGDGAATETATILAASPSEVTYAP